VAFYGNFAFFRVKLCVVFCPYGRLLSVLIDDDALVVGYDEKRGEPRAKLSKTAIEATAAAPGPATTGDCIECNRCVVVCPTGIDIREGLQLDCLACTACIDACDDVMDKVGRQRGLIRYDSLRGLRGEKRRFLRPRLAVYTGLRVIGAVVATFAFRQRESFEANIVRLPGMPYTREGGTIRNAFELHVVNKQSKTASFEVEAVDAPELTFVIPMKEVEIEALGSRRLPFFVTMEQSQFKADRPFVIRVHDRAAADVPVHTTRAVFLGAAH
jgi:cytochrome c oxidase accessory protein FixG